MARDLTPCASAASGAARSTTDQQIRSMATARSSTLLLSLAIFILALLPRLVGLGRFAFPDEETWLERSLLFITGLARGDLMATWQNNHPGVVPMWGFGTALSLRAAVTGQLDQLVALSKTLPPAEVPALLSTAALFTALVTALGVVGVYLLTRRLLGNGVALLAALLVALDPFFLTHSRIVHLDGILAALMICSALAFLNFLVWRSRRFLIGSAVLWGLALLTKSPALFLIPFALLIAGLSYLLDTGWQIDGGELRRLALAFAVWLFVGWAVFLLLWPAAWLHPLDMTLRILKGSRWGVVTSHGTNFFLGQQVATPGLLYYAVILPLRLTPITMIGGLAAIPWLGRRLQSRIARPFDRDRAADRETLVGLSMLAYAFFFALALSLAAKKGERYLVPAFPAIDVLTALLIGLLIRRVAKPWPALTGHSRNLTLAAIMAVLAIAASWLRLAPYYGAYFNPLAGGGQAAVYAYPFGQGEGLDLAAEYLNVQPDATTLSAASFYPRQLSYYLDGTARSLRRDKDWGGTWRFSDYVVFYVSQVQRELPTAGLVHLFRETQQPVFTARLGDVDFAWVYRSPALLSGQEPAQSDVLNARVDDRLVLAGFDLGQDRFVPGQTAEIALRWRVTRAVEANHVFRLRLVDESGQPWLTETGQPFDGYYPTGLWPTGKEMRTRYRLPVPADLTPGRYCWEIDLVPRPDWQDDPLFHAVVSCQPAG